MYAMVGVGAFTTWVTTRIRESNESVQLMGQIGLKKRANQIIHGEA
jgi:hypothetical protein